MDDRYLNKALEILEQLSEAYGDSSRIARLFPSFTQVCRLLNLDEIKKIEHIENRIQTFPSSTSFDAERRQCIDTVYGILHAHEVRGNLDHNPDIGLITFELTNEDREKLSQLCTQMLKIIRGSEFFSENHRGRLIRRVHAIEIEIFRSRGKLDVILAGAYEVSETLGKIGRDIQPLTDRIIDIVTLTRSRSNDDKLLPPPEDQPKIGTEITE